MLITKKDFYINKDVVFLNHGSFGACPKETMEIYQKFQIQLEHQPVEFLDRKFEESLDYAREKLANFTGAGKDELVFVPNTTTGLNIVMKSLDLKQGDEILTTDQEYGAMRRMLDLYFIPRGVEIKTVNIKLPVKSKEEIYSSVLNWLTPKTKVLFISHISSASALRIPVEEIIENAASRGVLTVVDGAHIPGQLPLDLKTLGADFYAGNCHKWLMTPKGSAFLYARGDNGEKLKPLITSWGMQHKEAQAPNLIKEFQYNGTIDISAYLSVPAGIEFLKKLIESGQFEAVKNLAREFVEIFAEETGFEQLYPVDKYFVQNMAAFRFNNCNPVDLKKYLYEKYKIEIPVFTLNNENFIRYSVQCYTVKKDLEILIEAVRKFPKR
ncbi:MAG: aminotransferase class V-fold PLP-dependent enzyme [Ignavibacteriaceae bacterium]|nr:aminotransferase class V-fold PLP-dependent enzyme [Ignavibacteriaceae bacterium]